MSWRTRRHIRSTSDFRIDNGRLNVADADVFKRDPVNLIRFFAQAERTSAFFHPAAIRLLRRSLRLIDDSLRRDPEANRIFLEILCSEINPEPTLRRMNEAGVLGRFIPDFGKVVSMMQFNMYHHYTVDEHLIRTVGVLSDIERGVAAEPHPLATKIFSTIQSRRALYVAAFLHDIAKGRPEDHSIEGARIARELCPRFGMSPAETDTVAWLIEQHLTMSSVAFSRDIGDPKTIRDFANIVQSPERLKLLLVLTIADIRAVGPSTWNGWKGQLLRGLYYEVEPVLAGGHTQLGSRDRVAAAQAAFRQAVGWPEEEVANYLDRHYPDYWLKTETEKAVEHAALLRNAERAGRKLASDFKTDAFTAITELTLFAPNHPRLLALFAGACAASGANISGAHISTTRDGFALDTFLLAREFDHDEDELRRAGRIAETIERLLKGEIRLGRLMAKRRERAACLERLHGCARGADRQRAVASVHGDRGGGPRPPGPSLRAHQRLVGPQSRHHLRAHHHLRRAGRGRVLCHGSDGQKDRQPGAPEGHPRAPAARCWGRIGWRTPVRVGRARAQPRLQPDTALISAQSLPT